MTNNKLNVEVTLAPAEEDFINTFTDLLLQEACGEISFEQFDTLVEAAHQKRDSEMCLDVEAHSANRRSFIERATKG